LRNGTVLTGHARSLNTVTEIRLLDDTPEVDMAIAVSGMAMRRTRRKFILSTRKCRHKKI